MKIEKTIIDVLKMPGVSSDSTSLNPATTVRTPPWPGAEWKATTHRWINPDKQAGRDKRSLGKKRIKGHSKHSPQWLKNIIGGRRGGAKAPSTTTGDAATQKVRIPKNKPTKKTKGKDAK